MMHCLLSAGCPKYQICQHIIGLLQPWNPPHLHPGIFISQDIDQRQRNQKEREGEMERVGEGLHKERRRERKERERAKERDTLQAFKYPADFLALLLLNNFCPLCYGTTGEDELIWVPGIVLLQTSMCVFIFRILFISSWQMCIQSYVKYKKGLPVMTRQTELTELLD